MLKFLAIYHTIDLLWPSQRETPNARSSYLFLYSCTLSRVWPILNRASVFLQDDIFKYLVARQINFVLSMLLPRLSLRTKFEKSLLIVALVFVVLFLYHFIHGPTDVVNRLIPSVSPAEPRIIFPANHALNESALWSHLKNTTSKDWRLVQVRPSEVVVVPDFDNTDYSPHLAFSLFHASANKHFNQCDAAENVEIDSISVSPRTPIPANFRDVLQRFVDEHDLDLNSYYKDVAPLMLRHVRAELKQDFILPFWFRLLGSSVWLKDHNVHFVISRFILADRLNKSNPRLSLTLAQVFDRNWNELNDVRLVFPTNPVNDESAPVFELGGETFSLFVFPRFLPIPFYHDYGKGGDVFGPEDPRVMLVRNQGGYDEPMITFNARQLVREKDENGNPVSKDYRSMFYSLPFQFQKGKGHLEGGRILRSLDVWFSKTKEINVVGLKRASKQKNWTPMISVHSRTGDYDKSIFFVTRLENLKVVKCDLYSDDDRCYSVYEMGGNFGDLRGGTPFININALLEAQHPEVLYKAIPAGREVYVGIARAHLRNCGCGGSFYRPNLVVITKDQASYFNHDRSEDRTQLFYKISHVSSSMSLEITMDPWVPGEPKSMCQNVNALIPNGIGAWKIDSIEYVSGRWVVDDTMSLSVSVSDNSVDALNVRGVLNAVFNSYDNSTFVNLAKAPQQFLGLPEVDLLGHLIQELSGFSNDNIDCALDTSRDFCKAYGAEQAELTKDLEQVDNTEAKKKFDQELNAFKGVLAQEA